MKIAIIIALMLIVCAGEANALGDGTSFNLDIPNGPGLASKNKKPEEFSDKVLITSVSFESIIKQQINNNSSSISGKMEGAWYFFGIGYRITERFEPYLRLGVSDLELEWTEIPGKRIKMEGATSFAVAGGIKMLAYKTKINDISSLHLGLDGQIRHTRPSVDEIIINGSSRSLSAEEFEIFEGRCAAALGFTIAIDKILYEIDELKGAAIVPYVGALYHNSNITAGFDESNIHYGYKDEQSKYHLNLITGVDLFVPKYIVLNIESQWFNDRSVSAGCNVSF